MNRFFSFQCRPSLGLLRPSSLLLAPRGDTKSAVKWRWTRRLHPEYRHAHQSVTITPTVSFPNLKRKGSPHPTHAMFPSRYPVRVDVRNKDDPRRDLMRLTRHVAALNMPRRWRFSLFHLSLASRRNIEVGRFTNRVFWLRLERLAKYFLFLSNVELSREIRREHILRGRIRHSMAIPHGVNFQDRHLPRNYTNLKTAESEVDAAAAFETYQVGVDVDTSSLVSREFATEERTPQDITAELADTRENTGDIEGGAFTVKDRHLLSEEAHKEREFLQRQDKKLRGAAVGAEFLAAEHLPPGVGGGSLPDDFADELSR
eukprot:TRINITY_DN4820_c0_g1_i1.p1 TRINITY_DN4820_c0_g1~~TRINITY_DN4820_c0_g1_i1.p1  ORF type:complete len:316 (-),score=39.25 TRINITY_DN4820_c0_g1_i1:90-1037(-)